MALFCVFETGLAIEPSPGFRSSVQTIMENRGNKSNGRERLSLRGTVVDLGGNALAGVPVHIEYLGPRHHVCRRPVSDRLRRLAHSDASGEFCFTQLPAGRYRVSPGTQVAGHGGPRSTAAFLPREVALRQGAACAPLLLQAVPHVVIEARFVDSLGRPRSGPPPILCGRVHGDYYLTSCSVDRGGRVRVIAPRGLQDVCLQLSTTGFSSVRHRLGKHAPLRDEREIKLGEVSQDVRGIEIVCYDPPMVVVRVERNCEPSDKPRGRSNNELPGDLAIAARYISPSLNRARRFAIRRGVYSHVWFDQHDEGAFCSRELLPEEPFIVTAHAAGYHAAAGPICLQEGQRQELRLLLEKM